ncbi:MAG: hypothetical protein ABMA13_20120 [Chthoniobacteraceae bacterium]
MSAAIDAFVEFLVAEMVATDSTTFADDLLTAAKAKIAGKGELSFLQTGTINGKTFGRAKELSAVDLAIACRRALSEYADLADGGRVTGTTLDFSSIGE